MPVKIKPIRVEGNIAYVPLTRGYEAIIDAADVCLVSHCSWGVKIKTRTDNAVTKVYAHRARPGREGGGSEFMHRLIAGTPPGLFTDHVNGDGLDNRRCNLRFVTVCENNRNYKKPITNTSGAKGVSWRSDKNRWRAQIKVNGRSIHLGHYDTVEAAAKAYADASRQYHGAFGRLA